MGELNSRELAILIWIGIGAGWVLSTKQGRLTVAPLLGALFQKQIVGVVLLAGAYVALCTALLSAVGLWRLDNLKTTLVWGITFGFVTIMDVAQSEKGAKRLFEIVRETLNATVVVVFVAEFYTLPLWGELVLVPLLFVLGAMLALARGRPEYAIIVKPLEWLLTFIVLGMLGYSLYEIATNLGGVATMATVREFAAPLALSLMFLPFLYLMIGYMSVESAAIKLQWRHEDARLRRFALTRAMLAFGADLDRFKAFVRDFRNADKPDRSTVKRLIRAHQTQRRRERDPPPVSASAGWSPYAARLFLVDAGLVAKDYHFAFGAWRADADPIEVGEGFQKDRIGYSISGTEAAATRLVLTLNASSSGDPQSAEAQFWAIAGDLVQQALGASARETLDGTRTASAAEVALNFDGATIVMKRDDWSVGANNGYERRLVLKHAAHQPAQYETD